MGVCISERYNVPKWERLFCKIPLQSSLQQKSFHNVLWCVCYTPGLTPASEELKKMNMPVESDSEGEYSEVKDVGQEEEEEPTAESTDMPLD